METSSPKCHLHTDNPFTQINSASKQLIFWGKIKTLKKET